MTTWICLFAVAATISSCLCIAAVAMNAEGDWRRWAPKAWNEIT
jgi:hypothetical protein